MPVPELRLRSAEREIREFCDARVPEIARHQVRLEVVTKGNAITIVERRVPWSPSAGAEWTTSGIARFRYQPRLGTWSLYWCDRHGGWHLCDLVQASPDVGPLIAEVERDPTGIFWG